MFCFELLQNLLRFIFSIFCHIQFSHNMNILFLRWNSSAPIMKLTKFSRNFHVVLYPYIFSSSYCIYENTGINIEVSVQNLFFYTFILNFLCKINKHFKSNYYYDVKFFLIEIFFSIFKMYWTNTNICIVL